MQVIKIGGSILSDIDSLEFAAEKIAQLNEIPIIVISAFKGFTDDLIKMNSRFCSDFSSFTITVGEQMTAGLFASALQKFGKKAKPLTGWQVPIIVDPNYEEGLFIDYRKIVNLVQNGIIPVITGFQGIDHYFEIKDLGRGGSDLTAISIAKAINSVCVLVKDVGGIAAVEPALVSNSFIWPEVGYDDLIDLASSGSKVVQKDALLIALKYSVPLKITNLDFSSSTFVVQSSKNFWSLLSYGNKLRVITKRNDKFIKNCGFNFCQEYNYHEYNNEVANLKVEAEKLYNLFLNNW